MNKLVLFLVLLVFLTNEILVMLAMACLLGNGRIFFALLTMFCLHYYAVGTTEIFKELIQGREDKNE